MEKKRKEKKKKKKKKNASTETRCSSAQLVRVLVLYGQCSLRMAHHHRLEWWQRARALMTKFVLPCIYPLALWVGGVRWTRHSGSQRRR
jgi:hypothetical protein